ncbi:MAG TPA: pyruvate ferredoxin oxidoreductase [Nitrospiria bacterium]|jgi:pyruvate ferredoxin oxidoreductase alpha subunit
MLTQIEGSQAVAAAVSLCCPEVISCYPITPQTHIVETLSARVKKGELGNCQFINAESEFGALSILIGASAMGARTYTATASQGLLFMAEAVYNASGLGLPIVMTIGNRAIGAPINIWNDHSDSMSMRDAGWIQLYAADNQEAVDLHILAFRLAEELSCPVMVCMDGFILTHAYEAVHLPSKEQVNSFLPSYDPVQVLDPDDPVSIGAMVGPEAFAEVRYLSHYKQIQALDLIPRLAEEFRQWFGRPSGELVSPYRLTDADTVVLGLGSVNGTLQECVDDLREEGMAVGSLKVGSYRPFPSVPLRSALQNVQHVIVVEKDLSLGKGGIVSGDVKMALRGLPMTVHTVIAGLGGRSITKASMKKVIEEARADRLTEPYFLDLNWHLINRELARQKETRRSGPIAENVLRDIRSVASKVV